MELELGLKITKTRDDLLSSSEIWFAKDRTGPIFLSRETESMFILTAYLKGYRKENIDIGINEDGTQIAISGNRPVQEMLIMGWIMTYQREEVLKGFRRVFRIPDGVNLDRIKARFEGEESVLTVVMPKRVKGIFGESIEEVQDMEPVAGTSESMQTIDDNVLAGDIAEEMLEEELDDNIQASEETDNAVQHGTEINETKPTQGRLCEQPATEHMEETGQASKENVDKAEESKERMPGEVLGKERGRKVYEEIKEPEEKRMARIKQVVDVPGDNREIEEAEAPPSTPPIEETKDNENKLQGEIDRPSSAAPSEIIENNKTKDIHPPEDQTRKQKSIDRRLNDKGHAVENDIDTVKHDRGKRKSKSSQGGLDGEPTIEHREETSRAREENVYKIEESKPTMPSEVPETERIRKIQEDTEELEETSMAQTSQVGDVPEEIQKYKEPESNRTLPPFQETKEKEKQLHGENDRPSSEAPPKIEEKIKDHLPQDQTRTQDAKDGRLDDKGQAVEKNINTVENERGKRTAKPSRGRLDGEPTIEHIEETRSREENACKIEESKATMPNEVQEIERIRKIHEDIEEPDETSMAQTSQVVDVPEDIRECKEVESQTLPSFQETEEKEEQLFGESVRPSSKAPQKIEERKINNIHLPEDQTRKQDAMDGRLDNKIQGVQKNVDTMECERKKRKAKPTLERLDGEPTNEQMEETGRAREEDACKIKESKKIMPSEVSETERTGKIHEEAEEPKETSMDQASQDVSEEVREYEEVESPPTITPFQETIEKEKQLRGENEISSSVTPPEIEERKIEDIHLPEEQPRKQDAMDGRLDNKIKGVEKNVDTMECERKKRKAKPTLERLDGEPTIEQMEETSRAREEDACKIKESKVIMPSEVSETERTRKIHEEAEEPKETSMDQASQDLSEEVREYEEVESSNYTTISRNYKGKAVKKRRK